MSVYELTNTVSKRYCHILRHTAQDFSELCATLGRRGSLNEVTLRTDSFQIYNTSTSQIQMCTCIYNFN